MSRVSRRRRSLAPGAWPRTVGPATPGATTPEAQWFANRSDATLQVNFRGSTGFGKAFHNAGNGQWGVGGMQHDLTDAVGWAIAEGIAGRRRPP